jgi:anthranilate phosphoribosyltransferase
MILKESIEKLMHRENLNEESCKKVLTEMLLPETNPLHISAFLVLLRAKGETTAELNGMLTLLKQKMVPVPTKHKVLDIVGTGGDGAHTFNISTGSAILAASCGIKVAKHGNRAVSSLTGSADVLETLGINIHLKADKISQCIDEIGIGFCFAPHFHPALRELRSVRKSLNVPTTFNLLGPLLNPANPSYILLGVFNEKLLSLMAESIRKTDTVRALIAHSAGLDEISCLGTTKILEVFAGEIKEYVMDPQQYGFPLCRLEELQGGDAKVNAQLLLEVFSKGNLKKKQAAANTLILNCAMALYLYGMHNAIPDAVRHARENLESGAALTLLKKWSEFSHDK